MVPVIRWEHSEDKKTVRISVPQGDLTALVSLDTAMVEGMAAALSQARPGMTPSLAETPFPVGQLIYPVADPKWFSAPDGQLGLSVLSFLHPLHGWLHFAVTPPDALTISRLLEEQAKLSSQPSVPRN